ncbi:hypothetical protein J4468_03110 [Candidatus Woesearchaeota archaeon]|nr:hypothetical protein [Candidatus Woesearchaeota archaeon]
MKALKKNGYLRTVEAVIAMLLVFGVIVYTAPKIIIDESEVPSVLKTAQEAIFDELTYNETIRKQILLYPDDESTKEMVNNSIVSKMPGGFEFNSLITRDFEQSISTWPIDRTVYVKDMMISSNLDTTAFPIVVRVYMWRK